MHIQYGNNLHCFAISLILGFAKPHFHLAFVHDFPLVNMNQRIYHVVLIYESDMFNYQVWLFMTLVFFFFFFLRNPWLHDNKAFTFGVGQNQKFGNTT